MTNETARTAGKIAAFLALVLMGAAPAPGASPRGDRIKVMTRNEYLGADLGPVVTATSPDEFFAAAVATLGQVAANDFPRRARGLAREVFLTRPDVIALQEVYDFSLNGGHLGPPFVDHLEETLAALAEAGLSYAVAGTAEHIDVTLPVDVNRDGTPDAVRMLDRDVILVRQGLGYESLAGNYWEGGLCGVPVPNPIFPGTLASTPAQDGCNFATAVQVSGPGGLSIVVRRGFLAVDVRVGERDYRVIDTHLEERLPARDNPQSAVFQTLQAVELVGMLRATMPKVRTLIVAGDFNSSPEDEPIGPIVPPYQLMLAEGYLDAWEVNPLRLFDPEGFTCCQEPDLSNARSELTSRIDHLFVKGPDRVRSLAYVTGRLPLFPLGAPPNWASDHGGVFGELTFGP